MNRWLSRSGLGCTLKIPARWPIGCASECILSSDPQEKKQYQSTNLETQNATFIGSIETQGITRRGRHLASCIMEDMHANASRKEGDTAMMKQSLAVRQVYNAATASAQWQRLWPDSISAVDTFSYRMTGTTIT